MATEESVPQPRPGVSATTDTAAPPAAPAPATPRKRPPVSVWSFSTTGLFVLACLYTLYLAGELLMPITAALILFLILWPVVKLLTRLRIPEPVGAAFVVLSLLGSFVIGVYFLSDPAARWMSDLPGIINQIQDKIEGPVEQIQEAKARVEEAMGVEQAEPENADKAAVPVPVEAQPKRPPEPAQGGGDAVSISLLEIVATVAASVRDAGWTLIIVFALLFFFLATGELYQEKIVKVLPTFRDKKRAVTIIRRVHHDVASYLLTVTVINCVLGIAVGVGLYLVGLPNPVLWGVMATALNFIPYIGALVGEIIVGVVGLAVFDHPIDALQPVAIYLALNIMEGQFITPSILGRRLTMNPLIVFIAVMFWGWLWGVPGALLAVPLLACFKVICSSFDRLQSLNEFLGR